MSPHSSSFELKSIVRIRLSEVTPSFYLLLHIFHFSPTSLVVNAASEDVEVRSYQINLAHPHQEIVQLASLEKSMGMFRYFGLCFVTSFWAM
jgi:hypothetical protein